MSSFPFAAVLFDCDGVLVDSEPITMRVLAEALGELGWAISHEEAMEIFKGKAVRDEAPLIQEKTGFALTQEWMASFWARRNAALEVELEEISGAGKAVREIHEMLDGRIAVASGADRRKVELQLARTGMLEHFAGRIFSGHEMARSKPFPDVYLAAAHALGVDAARCAVIEDTVTGAAAGVAAGATVFGYSPDEPGHSGPRALLEAGVVQVFRDMSELPRVLHDWRSGQR